MDVNDNAGYLNVRVVWTPIASRLAPTVERARQELLIAIIFRQPGMALPHEKVFAD